MSRYQAYPEYKKSRVEWIGEMPNHWNLMRVKEVADVINGYPFDAKRFDPASGVPLVRIRDIFSTSTEIKFDGAPPPNALINSGDILIGMDGDFNVASWAGGSAALNQRVACVRSSNAKVTRYLYYVLPFKMRVVNDLTYFTTVKHLSSVDISKTKFALPPYSELESIVDFLDHETAKIDALIEKQQRLIELLKEKRQAVISHAVTKGLNPNAPMKDSGVEWMGEVPAHWVVAKLSFRYEVLLGKMLDDKKITGNFLGSYLRNTDVQWDQINTEDLPQMDFYPNEQDRYSVKKLDLIVCEGGEIGRCAIWGYDDPCFYQKALHRLRPLNTNCDMTRFMFYHLFNAVHQERFISGAGKSTIAHLPAESFRQFRFAYPPLTEQVEISNFLDEQKLKFDALEIKALSQISLLKERRTALISAAVTGKIDVRDWQAAA